MPRPKGLVLDWLRTWCEANIRPVRQSGEARAKTVIQRIGDALPAVGTRKGGSDARDHSGVWRALEGKVGINREHWEKALRTLHSQHELSHLALEDFVARCDAEEDGRRPSIRRLADCFAPVQARLISRLEAGKSPYKAVLRAFSEASGLVCAWVLSDRWFLTEDLREGLPGVAALANKWASLFVGMATDRVTVATDIVDAHGKAEHEVFRVACARNEFFWRLITWLPRVTSWTDDSGKTLSDDEKRALFLPLLHSISDEELIDDLQDPRRAGGASLFAKHEKEDGQ